MLFGEARFFQSPFAIPQIFREPFQPQPAYKHLQPHWLGSSLGQRRFVDLLRRGLPSPLWPAPVQEAVIDTVADVLIAAVMARRQKGGTS